MKKVLEEPLGQNKTATNKLPITNVSVATAAASLGISRRKMDELIYKRLIAHVRIGARVLIPLETLNDFNSEHTVKAAQFDLAKDLQAKGVIGT